MKLYDHLNCLPNQQMVTQNANSFSLNILKNWAAFYGFIIGGHLLLWYEVYVVLPYYHGNATPPVVVGHYVVAAMIYINSYVNLFFMKRANPSGQRKRLDDQKTDAWQYCAQCQEHFPPRSHHCPVCNCCVLRRDHHCWFAACCVGSHNHCYYFAIIITIWIGAVYSTIFNYDYVGDQLGGYNFMTIFSIMAPHVAFVLGRLTFFQFFVTFMTFLGYFFMFLSTALILEQCIQIKNGQTKHERKIGIRKYDKGIWGNFREVLGKKWYLLWIFPGIFVDYDTCIIR